jgi:hypothetical protein
MSSALIILSACSSLVSVKNPKAEESDGLIYYLPKKDIVITFNVREENDESKETAKKAKNKNVKQQRESQVKVKRQVVSVANVDVTPAYPDGTEYYVLKHRTNLLGDNKTDIGINEKGLLSASTKAIMTSKVNDSFKNLAYSVGAGVALFSTQLDSGEGKKKDSEEIISCSEVGNYIFRIKFDEIKKNNDSYSAILCKMNVRIEAASSSKVPSFQRAEGKAKDRGESGIFYRQLTPYSVTITKNEENNPSDPVILSNVGDQGADSEKEKGGEKNDASNEEQETGLPETTLRLETIVFLPSSNTHFLPIAKSFFADNTADFAFVDGMPTKYGQDTKSEFAALFKLPGDIIGGFFGGVGAIFSNFKTINTDQSAALAATQQVEFLKFKQGLCLSAVRVKDAALVSQYCKQE